MVPLFFCPLRPLLDSFPAPYACFRHNIYFLNIIKHWFWLVIKPNCIDITHLHIYCNVHRSKESKKEGNNRKRKCEMCQIHNSRCARSKGDLLARVHGGARARRLLRGQSINAPWQARRSSEPAVNISPRPLSHGRHGVSHYRRASGFPQDAVKMPKGKLGVWKGNSAL